MEQVVGERTLVPHLRVAHSNESGDDEHSERRCRMDSPDTDADAGYQRSGYSNLDEQSDYASDRDGSDNMLVEANLNNDCGEAHPTNGEDVAIDETLVKRERRPTTWHVITHNECPDLAGWTMASARTYAGRPYHTYQAPGGKRKYKTKIAALRVATGTAVSERPTAAAVGKYPSRRAVAKKAIRKERRASSRKGRTSSDEDATIKCIDPRRAYSGPPIPRCEVMPADADLPGWTIERVRAVDGKEFLLYRDPSGKAVGSRGSALRATGQLFITRTEHQSLRYAQQQKELHANLLGTSALMTAPQQLAAQRALSEVPSFSAGEFEQILNDRFLPAAMSATCDAVLSSCDDDVRRKVVVVDMFSGCGGLSIGFRAAGFPYVMGVDECAACRSSYKRNQCGTYSLEQRIRADDIDHWHDAMEKARIVGPNAACELVLLGGPPCQPYTRLGQRAGAADERDGLPIAIGMAVRLRPIVFIMENVPGMLDAEFGTTVHDALQPLIDAGYTMKSSVHKCSNHGVPQSRSRMLISFTRNRAEVLSGDDDQQHKQHEHREPGDDSVHTTPLHIQSGSSLEVPRSLGTRAKSVRPEDVICEPGFWTGRCPVDLAIDLPTLKSRTRLGGNTNSTGIVTARQLAPTVITSSLRSNTYNRLVAVPKDIDTNKMMHADLRMLHTRHGLLLQTFPPGFVLYGNLALHASQIGNAVPPMLSYDVALGLKTLLDAAKGSVRFDPDAIGRTLSDLKREVMQRVSPMDLYTGR